MRQGYCLTVANPTVAPARRVLTGITRGRCQSAFVQNHLHPLLDSGRPTAGLDGGVEVEITDKPPLHEDATIPFDVASTAHLVELHDHPHRNFPNLPLLPSAHMYVLLASATPGHLLRLNHLCPFRRNCRPRNSMQRRSARIG